jgi:hypothetical protein
MNYKTTDEVFAVLLSNTVKSGKKNQGHTGN